MSATRQQHHNMRMGHSPTYSLSCRCKSHHTHIPLMKSLGAKLKLLVTEIKSAFKQIDTIGTQYAHSILVH